MDTPRAQYALYDETYHDGLDPWDGDLDLGAFYADNDFDAEVVNAIGALNPGEDFALNGGAGPTIWIRRVS